MTDEIMTGSAFVMLGILLGCIILEILVLLYFLILKIQGKPID